jgi:hypothetical protein
VPDGIRLVALVIGLTVVVLGANGWVAVAALAVVGGWLPGAAGALAMAATQLRWGTADLGAVAGDQQVLGAAIVVGPVAGWASAALGFASLLAATRLGPARSWSRPMPPLLLAVVAAWLWFRPWPAVAVPVVAWSAATAFQLRSPTGWPPWSAPAALVLGGLAVALAAAV